MTEKIAPSERYWDSKRQRWIYPGELVNIVAFLLGEEPLEGVWFGDPHPTEKGAFWWRKHLRDAAKELK